MNGFASMNAVNAAKGMAGTARSGSATFAGTPAPAGPSIGMASPGIAPQVAPAGSSYTKGAGMTIANQNVGGLSNYAQADGTIAGQGMPAANVGQQAPPMTAAQMQDPANAALAGYAYSATQDQPVQASQQPQQVAPDAGPIAGGHAASAGPGLGGLMAMSATPTAVNAGPSQSNLMQRAAGTAPVKSIGRVAV